MVAQDNVLSREEEKLRLMEAFSATGKRASEKLNEFLNGFTEYVNKILTF